ncbi:hypothetical protein [Vibrio atypicus]|uniref:hypothetical protein n=1 Tax=Vibrio atypicus TaxID=558271 RepID=UPI00135B34A8|nr:hypothetical protein [Vibrio atypicus]
MFVLISLIFSCAILAALFHYSKKRQTILQRKFETLVLLRQLLGLCREHRQLTHRALSDSVNDQQLKTINTLYEELVRCSDHLVSIAPFDNRPMYRIFQLKLKAMHNDWHEHNISRNQIVHGKTIRHCMFLMDEIAIAWLIESEREDLNDEYHLNWQQVLDSMEVLTQLQICIPESRSTDGFLRLKFYCDKTRRKLNQLSLISPLSIASPNGIDAIHQLAELSSAESLTLEDEELYLITSDISAVIAQVYDQMLSDMSESLYLPLPKISYAY